MSKRMASSPSIDNIRTFRGATMPETLAKVKRELGPHAVILGTRAVGGEGVGRLFSRDKFEITAAPPARGEKSAVAATTRRPAEGRAGGIAERTPGGSTIVPARRDSADLALRSDPSNGRDAFADDAVRDFYLRLVQNDVAAHLAKRILADALRSVPAGAKPDEQIVLGLLRQRIAAMLPSSIAEAPAREAFIGPAGSGKTTTLAKLAARRKLVDKKPAAILSLDVFRIGATQQLSRFAEILDAPLFVATTPEEAAARLEESPTTEHWLIDTPGVSLSDTARTAELTAILRALRCDAVHLVLASCTSAAVRARAAQTFAPLGVTDVILTKLDDAVGFGVILNVLDELKLNVSYCASGQMIPRDIEKCCNPRIVELILGERIGSR